MSIFSRAWEWLKKNFVSTAESADAVAITITEEVKSLLTNGTADFVANIIDSITKSGVSEDVVAILKVEVPKILAVELAVKGLPVNPTADDILAFEKEILSSFGVTSNTSKLYTVLAAQVYGIIQSTVNNTQGKFADWVFAVEQAYQDYSNDKDTSN